MKITRKKCILTIIMVLSLILVYINLNNKYDIYSKYKYTKDFQFVYNFLEKSYPNYYIHDNSNWFAKKEEFLELIRSSKNDVEFFNNMEMILREFQDPHVQMINRDGYLKMYPSVENENYSPNKKVRRNSNEIFNSKTAKAYGISENELKKACKEVNEEGYKFIDGDNLIMDDVVPKKIAYLEVRIMRILTGDRKEDIKEEKQLFDFLKHIHNYDALIIDLRRNPGGNPNYWSRFLLPSILGNTDYKLTTYYFIRNKKYEDKTLGLVVFNDKVNKENMLMLKKKLPALQDSKVFDEIENHFEAYMPVEVKLQNSKNPSLAFSGNLYVLVGEDTFSASDMMARMVKLNHIGKLVGRKTGGEGSIFPKYVRLPKTNFIMNTVMASGLVEKLDLENTIATTPDVEVKNSYYNIHEENGNLDFTEDKDIKTILEIEGY